jgi:hypothetical protein
MEVLIAGIRNGTSFSDTTHPDYLRTTMKENILGGIAMTRDNERLVPGFARMLQFIPPKSYVLYSSELSDTGIFVSSLTHSLPDATTHVGSWPTQVIVFLFLQNREIRDPEDSRLP